MCLLRKITYGEFSEFVREKKITYNMTAFPGLTTRQVYNITSHRDHYPKENRCVLLCTYFNNFLLWK